MRSVALGIWIATGGRYENTRNRGISHFLEHLLFKGTKKRTTSQIKNTIEGIGGSLNAFTSEEVTCYLAKVLGRHLKLGVDVLGDMVLNAKIDLKDIEKERFVILEEIKMYKDQPDQYANDLMGELMWPKQAMGIPLVGTIDTVNSVTRRDILAYRNRTYSPSSITVVACGDVDWNVLVDSCASLFSGRKTGKANNYNKMKVDQRSPKVKLLNKDTEQTHIVIGFHGFSRNNPLRYAMDLLNVALGANMSSRLFHELREKRGLAYAIGSHVHYYADGGAALIEAGVDNRKVAKAVDLMMKEVSRIKEDPITRKEFERAKEYYLGHLMFLLEDTASHMLWLGKKTVTGDGPIDVNKILSAVQDVTIDDVRDSARRVFRKGSLNIAIVGPAVEKESKRIKEITRAF
ncbi:MAG: insulinase family protein [Candidatus Omnitrophica bacterium]|nr:insulinase family protein [Candidatus Omnitrophota bacterium]